MVHSLELFATHTRSLQIKTFISKDSVTLAEEGHSSYESIWTEGSASSSKSLAYSKLSKKNLKTCKKWFGVLFFELFPPNTRLLQIKTLISKKNLATLSEETQVI